MWIRQGKFIFYLISFIVPFFLFGQGENYLWIGGSGNWSDTLHWYSESGGLPSIDDNVIFNSNSFSEKDQFANVDIEANCHDMNWSSALFEPILKGGNNLYISGSLIFAPGMTIQYSGNINFTASIQNHFIQLNGNTLVSDVYFDGQGSWNLMDTLDVYNKTIYLVSGTLNVMGKTINCGSFQSTSSNNRTLNIESSSINILSQGGSWIVSNQLNLMAANSTISLVNDNILSVNTFTGGSLDYGNVVCMNDAIINGDNSFGNLYLNAGHKYQLQSGNTQTLNGNLIARGCAGLIEIFGSDNSQANISKSNGDINISFVKLKSVHAIVSSPYECNAFNSIDDGNNLGINIYPESRDVYWINSTGYWTDTTHWTSSPLNEDSDCLPMAFDNVFFNDNSFNGADSVKVNVVEINCNSMTWTGNADPVFINTLANSTVTIYGSLQFSPFMKNELNSPFVFCDTLGGKIIQTANKEFKKEISFKGENGEWTIYDSLKINAPIHYFNGTLNTNNNYIKCQAFRSDSAFARTLNLSTSQILVTGYLGPYSWSLNNENLEFNSGTSAIELILNNSTFFSNGGNVIEYHDVLFSAKTGTARLFTNSDTYAKFHRVEFESNATIMSSNEFDTLSFSPGNYYELSSGSTQKINDEIYPSGQCDGPILLKSVTNGVQASIVKPNDTIRVENTSIRDINAFGGAVFIAENSVDLGNNNGWDTVMVTAPGKLFWVGGTGDWNDFKHWSLTSGGLGGECIPTPYDTVIFDQNSFLNSDEYANINLNNAFAHNMDWSEADFIPEFKGNNSAAYLRIYGSLKLNPIMEFTFPGFISFEASNAGQTIITEGIEFFNINNNVYFDGIGGEWTLMDSLQLGYSTINKNNIYYYNGDLNTNGQFVDCFGFYSNIGNPRTLSLNDSEIHICYEWNFNGGNLNMMENNSFIRIDSGFFIHRNGSYFPYHDVHFNAVNNAQYLQTEGADSVIFNKVVFESSDGKMFGNNGSIFSGYTLFKGQGQINQTANSNVNVYILDTLLFNSTGTIYGNDTVRNYVEFGSVGNITGNGRYANAYFVNDGNINGNNIFDTITFNVPYTYQLESQKVQQINDEFNIKGSNCEFIKLKASSGIKAEIYKESGSVYGDFIEMSNIKATGDAVFNAGYFSIDVNNSNEGWIFNNSPLNYSLPADTSILEGETIYICSENFNGQSGTTYEWKNCTTGEILGYDSCVLISERGHYCLTVTYDEGGGCTKSDDIFIGCYLDLIFDTTHVSCNGFNDGSIEMNIEVGTGPFDINWYNNNWLDSTQNIYNLTAGFYYYTIEDAEGCISGDTLEITEPEMLTMNYTFTDACYGIENGTISLEVNGGTQPYFYSWSNGSTAPELSQIPPGEYIVTVSDDHQCPSINKTIVVSELPELSFHLEGNDLKCYQDGTGEINMIDLTGGTGIYVDYEWMKDGQFFSNSHIIGELQAGEYFLTVTDDYGCYGSNNILIEEPDKIILELEGVNGTSDLGSIDLTVAGGTLPYSFLWNTGAITEDIDPLGGGTYSVEVTDAHSCKSSESIFIDVHYRIYAPTAFSPNNDNINDEFELFGLGTDLKEFHLEIYNRYGQIVFETDKVNTLWNGRFNNVGEPMPTEVYTWIAKLTYLGGESIIDKGNISLLR